MSLSRVTKPKSKGCSEASYLIAELNNMKELWDEKHPYTLPSSRDKEVQDCCGVWWNMHCTFVLDSEEVFVCVPQTDEFEAKVEEIIVLLNSDILKSKLMKEFARFAE